MSEFTVEKGKRYRATITLGLLQGFASNEMVAGHLIEAGFSDVHVTGSGSTRIATALWDKDTVTGPIPDEISEISALFDCSRSGS